MNRAPRAIVFLCLLASITGNAQSKKDDPFTKITSTDFSRPVSPAVDSSSNAVVLADLGVTTFKGNTHGWFSYVYKRKTRILILNKNAFDMATVKVSLYTNEDWKQQLSDVAAITYNLDNGSIVETKLAKGDMFSDKGRNHFTETKFTLPGVKEGSIIEYSYTIVSDFVHTMPSWSFQRTDCPTLWSEHQVTIPTLLAYITVRRGIHNYYIDKGGEGRENYLITEQGKDREVRGAPDRDLTVGVNTIKHRWVMKDIPALKPEAYLTTPYNYLDQLDFQLHQTSDGETMHDETANWANVTDKLIKDSDFGLFMTEDPAYSDWMKAPLAEITKDGGTPLEQARDIYYFIARNFDCTNRNDIYQNTNLKDIYKKRSGGIGGINLLLTAMLRKKNIEAVPVLLNTREYGFNIASYPVISQINYVICKATIDNRIYYLDASYHNLGFGFLPGNCYNGYARAISPNDSSSIYFNPDSLKEREVTLITVTNSDQKKNKLQGNFQITPGYIQSHDLRERIAKEGEKPFFKEMETETRGTINMTKTGIDSLEQREVPVKIWGDFDFNSEENPDVIYFSPVMLNGYTNNPFSAAVRKYPVEMNYPINETYILNMEIPAGFVIDELPQSMKALYNGGEGEFSYIIQKSEALIQLKCSLRMKSAVFEASDYSTLRDFFALVVKKQAEQIVFKKKPAAASTH